jgi:DNA-binding winged helix-turn-helix (wHTH) protein/tetratricopeptide (TPR) repeat protein
MVLRFSDFEFDRQRAELRGLDGKAIKLRPKTFDMLELFIANAGRVVSKRELMEAVWPNIHVGEDSLFQCIRELRTALNDNQREMIKLVSGRGYLFEAQISTAAVSTADVPPADLSARAAPAVVLGKARRPLTLRGPALLAAVAGLGAIFALTVAAPIFGSGLFTKAPTTIAVLPLTVASDDRDATAMATNVVAQLTDGLARIENIRVVAPPKDAASPAQATFVVSGELQKGAQAWTLQARMVRSADREVHPVTPVTVDMRDVDAPLQQSRLAAGIGHQLAARINELAQSSARSAVTDIGSSQGQAKVAIEQAMASITRTTRERFADAQTMLERALAADPDNIELSVTLAALQLRGIQMVWYSPDDARAAEANAGKILERALKAKPDSIPVLQTNCRFVSATNSFVDSLVACTRVLSFDPWNGLALYLTGLGQIHLGRFEDALATFRQADRYDTPQVSRWTWLLGAGWADALMRRDEDAVVWLQRSLAVTPATGRTHMLLAAVYQRLGRTEEAKAAMKKGLELRPGTTALSVQTPTKNASPVYLEASKGIIAAMVAAGLPDR